MRIGCSIALAWMLGWAANPAAAQNPPDQEWFLAEVVADFGRQYSAAPNEIVRSQLPQQRIVSLCNNARGFKGDAQRVDGWFGIVREIDVTMDGRGIVAISIGPRVMLSTMNNVISEIAAKIPTLVPVGSPLFGVIAKLEIGQKVRFSGTFVSHGGDCIWEIGHNAQAVMMNPRFLMQFRTIEPGW